MSKQHTPATEEPLPDRYRILWTRDEIAEFNARHDANYGWSYEFPMLYQNPLRLPETVVGWVGWEAI